MLERLANLTGSKPKAILAVAVVLFAIAVLEAAREKYAEKLARLREIEPLAAGADRFGPLEVLRYGLGMSEFGVKWCDENLKKLREMD